MGFKFDYSVQSCRLMLAAIMQVKAYDPQLLFGDQWRAIERHFTYPIENTRFATEMVLDNENMRLLEMILIRWSNIRGYPDKFIEHTFD